MSREFFWFTLLLSLNSWCGVNRAKNAIKEFRKRLLDSSGNAIFLTLLALDSLMKNCASDVHSEVLSVEFMGVIKTIITASKVWDGFWYGQFTFLSSYRMEKVKRQWIRLWS